MPDSVLPAAPIGPTSHFLTFRLDDRLYALPARDVAEVIRIPAVARMPHSPNALLGLANLRGEILPLASGRRLLGQKSASDTADGLAIVMNGDAPVAFAVDTVTELVELAQRDIETRQAELAALPGELLTGAAQLNKTGAVVKLLDIWALLNATFVARERSQKRRRQNAGNAATGEVMNVNSTRAKLVAFAIAGQDYALPLEIVREIVAAPSLLASIPHSEALVLGVTSLRDTLLPLLSLRGLLGFASNPEPQREKVIVAVIQGNVVGLVVDEMRDIFTADESRIDPIPDILAARTGGESRIAAIYRGRDGRGLVSILSPEQIFGDDVIKRLTDTHKAAEASDDSTMADAEIRQYLIFRLGDEEYGLPIGAVEEVTRVPDKISRVPNTPKFLEGVINLRGEVIPVVDQRRRFQIKVLEGAVSRRLVIVRTKRHIAGLIVDSVSEVLRAAADDIEAAPDLTGESTKLVTGVVNLDRQSRIVLLLDPAELLTRAERGLLDKFVRQQDAPGAARDVIKVLVVDDFALMRKLLGRIFAREAEFVVDFAPDGLEALDKLKSFEPNVITLDIHMPHMDGLACLDRIMVERPCPVVMVSSLTAADADATLEAFRLGAVDFVAKPGGTASLYIDELAPELLSKVRAAAGAKLKSSLRLKDRIRHQTGNAPAPARSGKKRPLASMEAAAGEGLVLVGTSTGGPPALEALLTGLPAGFPWPILIAQHMPATFTGPLARRLDNLTALTVMEVSEPVLLKAGCAYIARGGGDLVVSRRAAGLVASPAAPRSDYLWHPSTDRLVRSALECVPASQLVGVLMTGMGDDGAEAMTLLHRQGGRTIAEAEESAVVWGMPGELVKMGGADFIVALPGIAEQLRMLTPPCH